VQAPRAGQDRFAQLGVERRFDLDAGVIEERYRELSRKLHPDRFAKADAKARVLSLQAATALNDAYRMLRDPVKRAEYLLSLEGIEIGENEAVDPELLGEVLELRETLADARSAGDSAGAAVLAGGVRARRDEAMAGVGRLFAEGGSLEEIKRRLVSIRYFQRFLDEEERARDEFVADQ
jgi:molecular chaperone HscB